MKIRNLLWKLAPVAAFFTSAAAFAETTPAKEASQWGPIGAGLAIGLAAIGGALGQGRTAGAALEGMARNPQAKLLVPMIIGLALIESLVIYALLIAFQLV